MIKKIADWLDSVGDLKWIALYMATGTIIVSIYLFQLASAQVPKIRTFLTTTQVPKTGIIQIAIPTDLPTEKPTTQRDPRCIPASDLQYRNITEGLDTSTSVYINTAWAVKSNDYENVYYVAAMLYGPGMEEGAGPGVWLITGDPKKPGLTFSVGGFATSFSSWGDGGKTDAMFSQLDDGWQEANDCALADRSK
jgi:hypothetical protein